MNQKEKIDYIIRYFFNKKNWKPTKKEFRIVSKSYKNNADKILRLGKHSKKIKDKIDRVADWAESRNLDWSLGTVIKKWSEIDRLKPKEEKKKPYFRGERMYKKGDTWFVIPNDGGQHKEFAGSEDMIEWK